MPLPDPVFDTRTFRDLVAEATKRILVHTPEWTNQSDSDPGMTLLQLFAFIGESVIYRANRIPERNRIKFLRLLGVQLQPAAAAQGLVQFSLPTGPIQTRTLSAGDSLAAGQIPFKTTRGLDVLPIETGVFYKRRLVGVERATALESYRDLYASFELPPGNSDSLDLYETEVLEPPRAGVLSDALDVGGDTVDGIWIALFARRGDDVDDVRAELAGKTLSLGMMPDLDADSRVLPPLGVQDAEPVSGLVFEMPNVSAAGGVAAYRQLPASATSDPLVAPAQVEITLGEANQLRSWDALEPLEAGTGAYPPDLDADPRAERLITWVRVRLPDDAGNAGGRVRFRNSWIGINAAPIEQRVSVAAELLAQGTGEPDQTTRLANTPVLPESLTLFVNGTPWSQIDDLNAAPPEAAAALAQMAMDDEAATGVQASPLVFTLDPEAGEIRFGTGLNGARPPRGAIIQARYDHGGGTRGMVGIGEVKTGNLPSGVRVVNPVPTWGGVDGETVAEAERRIPQFIANRDRLVTLGDFETITQATPGVDVARVKILPTLTPEAPDLAAPGAVTIIVIPANDPRNPLAPEPDLLFLRAVCAHVAPRRLITTELHVRGPDYVDIWVSIAFDPITGRAAAPVREAVQAQIQDFFSPLIGGFDGTGCPFGRTVDPAEIFVRAAQVDGVARVDTLILGDTAGARAQPLELGPMQLPRLVGMSVVSEGDAVAIDALQGASPAPDPGAGGALTPVPVIPELC